nr:Uma2 family endonuclease [Gemmatimonas sp.]
MDSARAPSVSFECHAHPTRTHDRRRAARLRCRRRVLMGDPGVWLARDPDTVRAPDLAFVSRDRLVDGAVPDGFLTVIPDLAVEIRSPTDRTGALLQKVGQWLDAGVAMVWVIDPVRRHAQCYAADGTIALVGEHDAIDGGAVLPGLRIPLASLWSDALG